jgi:cardiolipin synthase
MLTWANRITLARICLIPLFVTAMLQVHGQADTNSPYRYIAFGLFMVMAITDAADGIIARARGEKSFLGRILDPLADKFLLTTACVLLSCDFWPEPRLPNWVPVLVISRDVIIVVGVAVIFLTTGALKAGPTFIGKVTTTVQMVTVLLALLNNWFPRLLVHASWWITVVLTCVSGLQYIYIGSRQFNYAAAAAGKPPPSPL